MYDRLRNKEIKLAVIGLGYVGLPLAMEFAGRISVIGFDIDEEALLLSCNIYVDYALRCLNGLEVKAM